MKFRLREFFAPTRPKKIIKRQMMLIDGIYAVVLKKRMKNIIIRVKPPDGLIQISAPLKMEDRVIEKFVESRLDWIREHQARMKLMPRTVPKQFESGEIHYIFGEKYQLKIFPSGVRTRVLLFEDTIEVHVPSNSGKEKRKQVLDKFYRMRLKDTIPQMITKWEPVMNVEVKGFGIKSMKTRWGTCNIRTQHIWLNLDLAKKPIACLEFIVVHEMVHLLERNHTKRFYSLMDKFLPGWRTQKEILEKFPAGHREWEY